MFKGEVFIGKNVFSAEVPSKFIKMDYAKDAQKVSSWTKGEHMLEKSQQDIFKFIDAGHSIFIYKKNELLGHGALTQEYPGKVLEIGSVIVSPDHRGEGIGSAVTYALLTLAKHEGYGDWVLFALANPQSAKLFEKLGAKPMKTTELGSGPWELCGGCKFKPKQTKGESFVCCDTPYNLSSLMNAADAHILSWESVLNVKNPNVIPGYFGYRGHEAGWGLKK